MEKERKNHKQEYFRKLRENAFLLEEIAELKKELTEAKKYRLPSVDMDAGSMVNKVEIPQCPVVQCHLAHLVVLNLNQCIM